MINFQFEAQVIEIVNSTYKSKDGTIKENYAFILFDNDGYEKTPNIRISQELFNNLKLNDVKEKEKYKNKICIFNGSFSFSRQYGTTLNIDFVKPKNIQA